MLVERAIAKAPQRPFPFVQGFDFLQCRQDTSVSCDTWLDTLAQLMQLLMDGLRRKTQQRRGCRDEMWPTCRREMKSKIRESGAESTESGSVLLLTHQQNKGNCQQHMLIFMRLFYPVSSHHRRPVLQRCLPLRPRSWLRRCVHSRDLCEQQPLKRRIAFVGRFHRTSWPWRKRRWLSDSLPLRR